MGAVELLEQDDSGKLVGQGQPAKREPMVDVVEVEPEWAPDDKAQVTPALPPLLEKPAEGE